MRTTVTSTASSGPAGHHFEGQVGAYYLLSMLTSTEPRGLSGTVINRISFQRAAEGYPLDDVIIHAHDTQGDPALLEIQVKRSITFAPSDPVFRKVVDQIAKASLTPDFWTTRHEFAIAIARTSRKIDGSYQDVLTWARQIGNAKIFMDRINRRGSANKDMRSFVSTFKSHLKDAGAPYDDETVWRLFCKLQILIFDFTATGSASEQLVKERTARALHQEDSARAGNLWTTLVELAIQLAASGGDRNRNKLIEDLGQQSFRLSGDRRYSSARTILAEASRLALGDIDNTVGDLILMRHERVAAVHAALDKGRYIEIRGDAGVGKSGVLKHFAEQISTEAQIVVLSPGRTKPRGWTEMRAMLGFDGTARELLTDLAGNGGTILFVDNLDFFSNDEQKTVIDLVREASYVPGLAVIATARRNFGLEEPTWLPSDALDRLGRTEPIVIGELDDSEVEELRNASPMLAPLLAKSHPARKVTRNLFRLARLACRPKGEPEPRTEVDMAMQWWQTADGKHDDDLRERSRLLKAMAEHALSSAEPFDVSNYPPKAVNALIASETLREFKTDRVAFRHDVLREWAIANLLHLDLSVVERLPLDYPTTAALARGVELLARIAIESQTDDREWQLLVERFSRKGIHGSWRRAVLLALVRSEIGLEQLGRASVFLLANRAKVLRELIGIVRAVEVQPLSTSLISAKIDSTKIPESLNAPSGPSWYRLIQWLLSLGQSLPAAAIPDVVDFYSEWSAGMLGLDPLTPSLLVWLYYWLTEIETSREVDDFPNHRNLFGGEIDRDRIGSLETNLRIGFLLFCNRVPTLAKDYLRSLARRRYKQQTEHSIIKFRGSLAQAAPEELAELTANALIPKYDPDNEKFRRRFGEAFDYVDHQFHPASPAQGPFLELLTHAPQHGLSLIHRLVDHAILFHSRGQEYGTNAITISFPEGDRAFPWIQSYAWARDWGCHHNCVTSALMALEAWAHSRIEGGESIEKVLADVLGPSGSPTAYLLVAVDLQLSHWPNSRETALPFISCPELLSIDLDRYTNDNFEVPDLFGQKALEKEPVGAANLESLKKRPSRRHMLSELLNDFALNGPDEQRKTLTAMLLQAMERLGPPDEQSDLGDPRFMVVHALNSLEPKNWREVPVSLKDGTKGTAYEYVPPEAESRHLAPLQEDLRVRNVNTNMRAALTLALKDPSRSSSTFAATAVEWAKNSISDTENEDADEDRMNKEAIVTAAMISMRDGDADLRIRYETWARSIFSEAIQTKEDPVHRIRSGLQFNPIAIAFVGMTHLYKHSATTEDLRAILEVAASENPAAAHGFGSVAITLASIDERLPCAILRCAFSGSIRPTREWDLPEEEFTARSERYQHRVQAAIDSELAWLIEGHPEPDWPSFPSEPLRIRQGIRLQLGQGHETLELKPPRPDTWTDHQAAALWLRNARGLVNVIQRPWLFEIVRNYDEWTAAANGAGLEEHERIDHPPTEWNDAYYELFAYCLSGFTLPEIDQFVQKTITSLPDEPFFDVITHFLRSVDDVYFNNSGVPQSIATTIRSTLSERLMKSGGWKWFAEGRSTSVEIHIGPAIGVLFFNDYSLIQSAKCYLLPKGIDRLDPFLPILQKLVTGGPSLFLAMLVINLFEVSPRPTHLPFIITSTDTWMKKYPDDREFWIDHGIGRRVCLLIDGIRDQEPHLLGAEKAARFEVDRLLTRLIKIGVADASRLEESLTKDEATE